MPALSPKPIRSYHGLTSPTNFSPEPPKTSPSLMQSVAGQLAGSLSRRKPGMDSSGRPSGQDGLFVDEGTDAGGTWTQSPFRDENLSPYAPGTSLLGGDSIPKYHYSLAWTRVDSMGVMKPVLAMRSQPWRSDRHVDIDRSKLWCGSSYVNRCMVAASLRWM